jgi:hypothetical protein
MAKSTAPKLPNHSTAQEDAQTAAWPGAFGIFDKSREAVRRNLSTFFALVLFTIIINMVITLLFPKESGANEPFSSLVGYLVGVWPSTALVIAVLASIRDEAISAPEALQQAIGFYLRALGLSILTAVIVALSFIALIVPFFFVYPRVALAPYFLIDKNLGPIEALKTSWEATRGQIGKVWAVTAVNILFALLIFVLVGIYLVFMYLAAEGLLYVYITSRKSAAKNSSAPVAPKSAA